MTFVWPVCVMSWYYTHCDTAELVSKCNEPFYWWELECERSGVRDVFFDVY